MFHGQIIPESSPINQSGDHSAEVECLVWGVELRYKGVMRIPDTVDEYEHMLNASGWSRQGLRKQGTALRKNRPSDFAAGYRRLVVERLEVLLLRAGSLDQAEAVLPLHLLLQKRVLEAEILRRRQQLASLTPL
jgi:hypothetical protein